MSWLWKHCSHCGHALGHPSDIDRILGITACPSCGTHIIIDLDERQYALAELFERINRLEQRRNVITADEVEKFLSALWIEAFAVGNAPSESAMAQARMLGADRWREYRAEVEHLFKMFARD